jgi:hypothetical protein
LSAFNSKTDYLAESIAASGRFFAVCLAVLGRHRGILAPTRQKISSILPAGWLEIFAGTLLVRRWRATLNSRY